MSDFFRFWKTRPYIAPRFEKAMTQQEIHRARAIISVMQDEGKPSSMIIKRLQEDFDKLRDEVDASRVYWTETKRIDTKEVTKLGDELGFSQYKVVLSPSACPMCRQKTQNGAKVFSQDEVTKTAYGAFVPFHPNCYCIALPYVE